MRDSSLPAAQRKSSGSHYTPTLLADFVARQITGAIGAPEAGSITRVLDPAAGDGALLDSLLSRPKVRRLGGLEAHGYDTNASAVAAAQIRLETGFQDVAVHMSRGDS